MKYSRKPAPISKTLVFITIVLKLSVAVADLQCRGSLDIRYKTRVFFQGEDA